MRSVVFVAPFFLDTTLRFVEAVADLAGVRTGLISQDPVEKLPPALKQKLAAHWRVTDGLDPQQIADAVRGLARQIGPPQRLIGALEQLQVPLGEVRDALGIEGMGAEAAKNFRDKARMKTVLQRAGVPCARHARVTHEDEAWAFAAEVGYPMVIKPTAGSDVGANSVELASAMPQRFRTASITAICMPKQMPKYGTWRSRANCAARIFPSAPRWPKPPGTRMPLTCSRNGAGSSFSNTSDSIQSRLTLTLLAMPPWDSASVSDL